MQSFIYSQGKYSVNELRDFEVALNDLAEDFSATSKYVNVFLFSAGGFSQAFSNDILGDLTLVQVSITLVAVYTILFMGGFSPIHFRSAAAGITLLCVGFSYAASAGLAYMLGWQSAGIHSLLPFLLIGIGVDDMFVISAAID